MSYSWHFELILFRISTIKRERLQFSLRLVFHIILTRHYLIWFESRRIRDFKTTKTILKNCFKGEKFSRGKHWKKENFLFFFLFWRQKVTSNPRFSKMSQHLTPCLIWFKYYIWLCYSVITVSKITTFDNSFCLEPETGQCNPSDGTVIKYRSTTSHCKNEESDFIFNRDTGKLIHKCSNKPVCVKDESTGWGEPLVVSSACKEPTSDLNLARTYCKIL